MIELKGKYTNAKVFNNNAENGALTQINELLNQEFLKDSKIRIMPDIHAGTGCVIGTTMTLDERKIVVPNIVGVDIGCGMQIAQIAQKKRQFDLGALDNIIYKYIPAGKEVRSEMHKFNRDIEFDDLLCAKQANIKRAELSLGTLGGGNHFIELNEDDEGNIYIVIHSGSRNLGSRVCEYYQELGYQKIISVDDLRKEIVRKCREEGRDRDIPKEVGKLKKDYTKINRMLAYVEGEDFDAYIHDMKITQKFAVLNRKAMMDEIVTRMKFDVVEEFTTIHNYIDTDNMILRKGAISAQLGEKVLIPLNMRDGSLICIGKGNEDWNYSAPHGAGRLMSRGDAKQCISMDDYRESMKGIYTSCVNANTLDESAFAYKPMEEIVENVKDTIDIQKVIKPIYNFKSSEEGKSWKQKKKEKKEKKENWRDEINL